MERPSSWKIAEKWLFWTLSGQHQVLLVRERGGSTRHGHVLYAPKEPKQVEPPANYRKRRRAENLTPVDQESQNVSHQPRCQRSYWSHGRRCRNPWSRKRFRLSLSRFASGRQPARRRGKGQRASAQARRDRNRIDCVVGRRNTTLEGVKRRDRHSRPRRIPNEGMPNRERIQQNCQTRAMSRAPRRRHHIQGGFACQIPCP
jgi:hypothetical protein